MGGISLENHLMPQNMCMKPLVILIALLINVILTVSAEAEWGPPHAVFQCAQALRPGAKLEYLVTLEEFDAQYRWSKYYYESIDGTPSYGMVHVLWRTDTSTPIWGIDWFGDFQPHSKVWLDFNSDGLKDLFFFAGQENIFSTYIYLWNVQSDSFSTSNLMLAYKNENSYSVIIDMDNDGQPEILDSGHSGKEHINHNCFPSDFSPLIPDDVKKDITSEYWRLAGKFDRFNFTYNMPEHYPIFSMCIFDPIKIYKIDGTVLRDVTVQYQNHLKWRLMVLERILPANHGDCQPMVESVIDYLSNLLMEGKAKD